MNTAFLIDIDGVLFPTEESKVNAYNDLAFTICKERGYSPIDFPPHPRGRPTSETLSEWINASSNDKEREIRESIVTEFKPRYSQVKNEVYGIAEPYPESEKFIRTLYEKGIPMCLVTTITREIPELLMKRFEWMKIAADNGKNLVALEDVQKRKPNPDPYLKAAKILGVAPADCRVIEDSNTGVRAGLAAEVHTVYHLLKWQKIDPDLVKKTRQVTDLMQIIELI